MTWGIIAGILSFILTLIGIPLFIHFLKQAQVSGQEMQEEVTQHVKKTGTPTMGGFIFVTVSVLLSIIVALFSKFKHTNLNVVILVFVLYAGIGFFDDFLKVFRHKNEGLKAWQKFSLQVLIGIIAYFILVMGIGFSSIATINYINLFSIHLKLSFLFIPFLIFWLVGWSNAINLTDGIDGLAAGSVSISLLTYAIIAYLQKASDIFMIIIVVLGSLLAFLVFNKKPAMIFMGDMGSLALGAFLASISVVLHVEWTLLFIGIIYIIETLSSMIQIVYFRATNGKRIFRMAPFHHHLELGGLSGRDEGWSEWKIDKVFWLITAVASLLTLILYLILK
ncbi:MAG: phospho-N-acetylmuramoyl-pentapeptide-transferase [Lactovum sp.]